MRVLHVAASMSPEWGGPVETVAALCGALARRGVTCEVATTVGHRVGAEPVSVPGVPVHCFPTSWPARLWAAYAPGLRNFLHAQPHQFEVIHVHELWHHAGFTAFYFARKHGVPVVQTLHGALDGWRLRQKRIRKLVYGFAIQKTNLRAADAIHTLVAEEERQVESYCGGHPRFLRAPNGVDPDEWKPAPNPEEKKFASAELVRRFPQLKGRQVILFLGRLHRMKGLDILARSFVRIAERFPDTALLVVGPEEDGSGRRMEQALQKAGVRDRAVFAGFLTGSDKLAAFHGSDLFVLPSYSEGFSMAALEAMACGLPVVLSEACNFPEAAEHEAGLVVEADDTAVADAVGALLSDRERRERMGVRARELVVSRYSWDAVAATVAECYRELCEKKSEAAPEPT